jgi:transcription termination factor Rho
MNDRRRFRDRSNRPAQGGRPNGQRPGGNRQGQSRNNHRNNGNGNGGGGRRREEAVAAPLVDGIAEGILSIIDERSDGTLRDSASPLRPARGNIIVPRSVIQELHLRPGLLLKGVPSGKSLGKIDSIEGRTVDEYTGTIPLYDATAMDPEPVLRLENDPAELTTRIIDILTPVGFGQRGLIVAPPRTGKTILLQNIAKGIGKNYPNVELVLLLVDERPEEVTDMRRNIPGTVYASSNDNTIDKHLDLAQLVIERCKRKVELGQNVVVLLDSLTRVGRAFNSGGPSGGRTMSGGLDNRALEIPKKLFGAARKIENGGSLTILATCLIDTGSRMDQVIFEEFKGTGNAELHLDRRLVDRRVYPAIDINSSGTRREELLLDKKEMELVYRLRRVLSDMNPVEAVELLKGRLEKVPSNAQFLMSMNLD